MTRNELADAIKAIFDGRTPDENEVFRVALEYGNTCRAEALAEIHRTKMDERARIKMAYERHVVRPFFDAIDNGETP